MLQATRTALATVAVLSGFPAFADTDDKAAIMEIWSSYSAARVAGDSDTWLGLWDKEGIRLAPGAPAADYGTFSQVIPGVFENSRPPSMSINAHEVVIAGDWAFSSGDFKVGTAVEGKFLTIFRRQDDGGWRIYRDAFNMNSQ